jgi:hypothetical protein
MADKSMLHTGHDTHPPFLIVTAQRLQKLWGTGHLHSYCIRPAFVQPGTTQVMVAENDEVAEGKERGKSYN